MNSLIEGPQSQTQSQTSLPDWWTEGSRKAWEAFESLPMPSRKDEDWRFASIKTIQLDGFQVGKAPETPSAELPEFEIETSLRFRFINGDCVSTPDLPADLKEKGVVLTSLLDAVANHPDLIREYFMKHEEALGNRKFAHLHRAFVETGAVLFVPANVEIPEPVVVEYWLDGENAAVFPHTLIVAGENSSATLIDSFRSSGEQPGVACAVNDLHIGQGARVSYLCTQEWNEKTLSFQINASHSERDAHTKSFFFNTGGNFARLESIGRVAGPGARSELLGLSLLHDRQEFDQRTLQLHDAPHTWSDLLFKNTLNHRGKSIFSGLIKVAPGAKQTDAYQTNRNLLLDPNAEADSMPGLEIANDDVKCSHGATTSQIEEEPLFYMGARGIPNRVAQHLIAIGFCREILERFDDEAVTALLEKRIEEKFRRSEKMEHEAIAESDESGDSVNVRQLQGTV